MVARTRCKAGHVRPCWYHSLAWNKYNIALQRIMFAVTYKYWWLGDRSCLSSAACASFSSGTGLNIWGFITKSEPQNLHWEGERCTERTEVTGQPCSTTESQCHVTFAQARSVWRVPLFFFATMIHNRMNPKWNWRHTLRIGVSRHFIFVMRII